MNKKTNSVAFYIFIFFIIVISLLGSFFMYRFFSNKTIKEGGDLPVVDKDFNDIIKKKEEEAQRRKNEKKVEYEEYENPPCVVKDEVYKHGTIKKFYSRSGVGVYESCEDFSEVKKCDNGFWLGDSKFYLASCVRSVDCKLGDSLVIENGKTLELYSREVVPYGNDCEKYKGSRTCKETILTGSKAFKYQKCRVSNDGICKIPNGNGGENILADNRSHTFYSKKIVKYDESCSDFSKNRLCSKGILYGDPKYYSWTCSKGSADNCIVGSVEIEHGTSRTMFSKTKAEPGKTCKFFAQIRSCNNGILDGQEEYSKAECVD